MVTTSIDFFTRQSNGQLLILDKQRCDNEQTARAISHTGLVKGLFVFIAPDKV